MVENKIRTWPQIGALLVALGAGPSVVLAGTIAVKINGISPPTPSSGSCSDANTCVNIGGTYGVLTVTPFSGSCAGGTCARVIVPVVQDLQDSLQVTNTKITNTGTSNKTFLLVAEREDVPLPSATLIWYNTSFNAIFPLVAGNAVTAKSYYKASGGAYTQLGLTRSHTVTCTVPGVSCTNVYAPSTTGSQITPNSSPRWIKIELSITLKPQSYITLNSGHTFQSTFNPP